MKTLKILYVEDHEMVRESMKLMLTHQGTFNAVIDVASDGNEAIRKAMDYNYDLILMDINMPDKDGIEVTNHLFNKGKKPKVLALSMHEEDYIVKKMLDAGALGYINKNSGIEELTKAILTVADNKPYYSNEVAQILLKKTPQSLPTTPFNNLINLGLTKREIQVLQLLANNLSNREVAENLNLSIRTVRNHRFNLMQKLDIHNISDLIDFARKHKAL